MDGSFVLATTTARLGSSAQLRRNLEQLLKRIVPESHHAHHRVPLNVVGPNKLYQKAMARNLYDPDRAGNGIFLKDGPNVRDPTSDHLPYHNGSHRMYDEEVQLAIRQILRYANIRPKNLSDRTIVSDQMLTDVSLDIEAETTRIISRWRPQERLN